MLRLFSVRHHLYSITSHVLNRLSRNLYLPTYLMKDVAFGERTLSWSCRESSWTLTGFSLGKNCGMHTELGDYFKSWFSSGFRTYILSYVHLLDEIPFDKYFLGLVVMWVITCWYLTCLHAFPLVKALCVPEPWIWATVHARQLRGCDRLAATDWMVKRHHQHHDVG